MAKLALFGGKREFEYEWPTWPCSSGEELNALDRVLKSRRWFSGFLGGDSEGEVGKLEREFQDYNATPHAIAVANGEAAIVIALRAAGIGAGDEVILPAWTFMATASAIMHLGAIPVFADISPDNLCLDPEDVSRRITGKTRAIITVHYGGRLGNIEELLDLAERKNLVLIEDAAHAHGSDFKSKKAGNFGQIGCFSFQESKTMTSGEGGMITTADEEIAVLARSYRSNGRSIGSPGYLHYRLGWNYRMTEFQAAILRVQLGRLDEQVKLRTRNAHMLSAEIDSIPGFMSFKDPEEMSQNSYYLYPFRLDLDYFGIDREKAINYARSKGIDRDPSLIPASMIVEDAIRAEGLSCHTVYIPLYRSPLFESSTWEDCGMQLFRRFLGRGIDLSPLKNCDRSFDDVLDISQYVLLSEEEGMSKAAEILKKISDNADEIRNTLRS